MAITPLTYSTISKANQKMSSLDNYINSRSQQQKDLMPLLVKQQAMFIWYDVLVNGYLSTVNQTSVILQVNYLSKLNNAQAM